MKATLRPGLAAADTIGVGDEFDAKRGDFEIVTQPDGRRYFWMVCPGRCGALTALAIRPASSDDPSWELSGTPEAPTLKPSIDHRGCWHGWLTDGEFTSC